MAKARQSVNSSYHLTNFFSVRPITGAGISSQSRPAAIKFSMRGFMRDSNEYESIPGVCNISLRSCFFVSPTSFSRYCIFGLRLFSRLKLNVVGVSTITDRSSSLLNSSCCVKRLNFGLKFFSVLNDSICGYVDIMRANSLGETPSLAFKNLTFFFRLSSSEYPRRRGNRLYKKRQKRRRIYYGYRRIN